MSDAATTPIEITVETESMWTCEAIGPLFELKMGDYDVEDLTKILLTGSDGTEKDLDIEEFGNNGPSPDQVAGVTFPVTLKVFHKEKKSAEEEYREEKAAREKEKAANIKATFKDADKNGDGFISKDELWVAFEAFGDWNEDEFAALYTAADKNADDKLSYDEFVDWVLEADQEDGADQIAEQVQKKTICKKIFGGMEAKSKAAEVSPFLAEYFQKIGEMATEISTNEELQRELFMADDPLVAMQEYQDKGWKVCEALLEKSFKHHDTDNSNHLSKQEADVFFRNLVANSGDFFKAVFAGGIQIGFMQMWEMQGNPLAGLAEEEKTMAIGQIKEMIDAMYGAVQGNVDEMLKAYEADKEAKNKAAFKVIDVDEDGTIQLSEFISALNPNGEKHASLKAAVGVDESKLMPEQPAGDCSIM